jgi:hypothetical protein
MEGRISLRAVVQFGIPSVIVLFVVRRWLPPAFRLWCFMVRSGGFEGIVDDAGIYFIDADRRLYHDQAKEIRAGESVKRPRLLVQGALTGAVTGFIGIGAGSS